jgi:hypothetical protein
VPCCLRCCSANCFRATCDGSFTERKPSTELPFFFFFVDDLESLEEEALEDREARLDDVRLVVSKGAWELMDRAFERGVVGGS